MLRSFYLLLLLTVPDLVEAAVTIHEVAWMGDTASANHEWIELYNSGTAAVSLEGWTLSDGINLSIALTDTLSAGAYAVLERTSEESAPGTSFLIYTGALVNTGATLTLRDAAGVIQDQVPGGEDWQSIGGDNTTKETAQYTDRGWVTAPATPGRANASSGTVPTEKEPEAPAPPAPRATASARTTDNVPVLLRNTGSDLSSRIGAPTQAYVNQSVKFTLTTQGAGPNITASLKHGWNFGDTYTASGTHVTHTYSYPGTYVVTVRSSYAKHDETARHTITILPVRISLGRTGEGDIILNNDAPYEVDISGYRILGNFEVVMPQGTIILERGSIIIRKDRIEIGVGQSQLALYDARGQRVITEDTPDSNETILSTVVPSEVEFISVNAPGITPVANPVTTLDSPRPQEEISVATATFPEVAAVAIDVLPNAPENTKPNERWPYLALLVLTGVALFFILREPKNALDRDSVQS